MLCGRVPEAAASVIREVCELQHAPLIRVSDVVHIEPRDDGETLDVRVGTRSLGPIRLSLAGRHQRENAAVAVAVMHEVSQRGIVVGDAAMRKGLAEAQWPARLERFVRDGVDILLDAAHNPAGARALASHLQDIGWFKVTILFGAMRDKDVNGMLATLAHVCERVICTTPPSPRALPADELADVARRYAPVVEVVPGDW